MNGPSRKPGAVQNIPLTRVSPCSLLADGDVVFVDASEDDEGTSKHVVVINKERVPFISGLHTIVAKSKTGELTHEYRRYCFHTLAIRRQFLFYAVGTKVAGIYELDGDTLKVCYAHGKKERPKEFKTAPGSGLALVIYKRIK